MLCIDMTAAQLEAAINDARQIHADAMARMSDEEMADLAAQYNQLGVTLVYFQLCGDPVMAGKFIARAGSLAAMAVMDELRRRKECREMED